MRTRLQRGLISITSSLAILGCGDAPSSAPTRTPRVAAVLPSLGGDASCDPYETPLEPSLCEWLGGFHAVVSGTVRSLTLVDTPMASYVDPLSGPKAGVAVVDEPNCAGQLKLALRLEVDVTEVISGDVSAGPLVVHIGAHTKDSMYPFPTGVPGMTPTWDGGGEAIPLAPNSWVGLPLVYLPDVGWSLAFEAPFGAGDTVTLARVEYCGEYPRPKGLDGMKFDDLVATAALCDIAPTSALSRRVGRATAVPGHSYAAWCAAPIVVHECDTDAECLNSTTCEKHRCVVPGFGD